MVLVILAILAAFTIPAMLGFVEDARGKAAISEAREVYVAAQAAASEFALSSDNFLDLSSKMSSKLNDYLAEDLDADKDYFGGEIVITAPGQSNYNFDLIKETQNNYGKKVGRVLVVLDSNNQVEKIQYIDKQGRYGVTIIPGGSAEVTKIK
ncbi:MAG: hypothetical protein EUB_01828 [Eubacterium sp.]